MKVIRKGKKRSELLQSFINKTLENSVKGIQIVWVIRNIFILCSHRVPYFICSISDYRLSICYDRYAKATDMEGDIPYVDYCSATFYVLQRERSLCVCLVFFFPHSILSYSMISLFWTQSYVLTFTASPAASSLPLVSFFSFC